MRVVVQNALARAEDSHLKPTFDQRFSIFYYRGLHEESTYLVHADVVAYMNYGKLEADAKKWDEAACRHQHGVYLSTFLWSVSF